MQGHSSMREFRPPPLWLEPEAAGVSRLIVDWNTSYVEILNPYVCRLRWRPPR